MPNVFLSKIPLVRTIFKAEMPDQRARRKERSKLLWRRCETSEGLRIVAHARTLSRMPELAHFSNTELIRLAYWGHPGETDTYGREMLKAPENRTYPD